MSTHPIEDRGQKLPSLEGKVVGFVQSRADCEDILQALHTGGYSDAQISVFEGEESIHILKRSRHDYFMGDGETETITSGLLHLQAGMVLLAVQAKDERDAVRISQIATRLGGHGFNYFGKLISERLTK